ncbi:alpha-galactosidase [Photobacterium angustum]|uniref:Enterotoxin n=1 Tax=Photobacterium angustum TaxID=661 RepID=A0ABX5H633_PHOAN|nr:enterotoxin [Photobacterium angustum]PSX10943.1 enterotoxin [Photobacterium angustum]
MNNRKFILSTITMALLLSSQMSYAKDFTLHSDNLNVVVSGDKANFTDVKIENLQTKDTITTDNLFYLQISDNNILNSSDFTVDQITQKSDQITISMSSKNFEVTNILALHEGKYLTYDFSIKAKSTPQKIDSITLLPFHTQAPFVDGAIESSPIISDHFVITPQNPLVTTRAYEGGVTQNLVTKLPIRTDVSLQSRTYISTFEQGQLRRNFNEFLNLTRKRPYAQYLHYNSWLDIGFFTHYNEADALDRIEKFGHELIEKRHVAMSGFLLDDGWDDRSGLWNFSQNFPHGFTKIKDKAHKYNAELGVWLSPWGGYNTPLQERVSHAKENKLETINGKFALSGPNYYENFHSKIIDLISKQNVSMFKLDGTGNASNVIEGSKFTSDFDAAIHLINDMSEANKDLFINLTTGTNASPSWLFYADSIWRQGDDINFYGEGSDVQKWITYRDAETYRSIVKKGPLFPLNSLMLHGIVYAKNAKHLDKQSAQDFNDQVWSYFATGTQLQELYITPDLLTKNNWDVLATAANWAKNNTDVLFDSHWIGNDPTSLDVYGWAAWSKDKSIVTLRNPSNHSQSYYLDLKHDLELPNGESDQFKLTTAYGENKSIPLTYSHPVVVTLKPLQTMVLEATPS